MKEKGLEMKTHDLDVQSVNWETRVKVDENGRVLVPTSFRRALDIHAGDELFLRVEDDELRITTLKCRLRKSQRLVRKYVKAGTSLVAELLVERREGMRK